MLEMLTGAGLAASAGLNAYIPLLILGIAGRYIDAVQLPAAASWLTNGWVLTILAVLLAVEVVADKIPVVDTVNDAVQTFVRPTSGGIAFGTGAASETAVVSDPGRFFTSSAWIPIAVGIVIALVVHIGKATIRPPVDAATAGVGTPVVSSLEDVGSVAMSVLALVAPIVALLVLVVGIVLFWLGYRRYRRFRDRFGARIRRLRGVDEAEAPATIPGRL